MQLQCTNAELPQWRLCFVLRRQMRPSASPAALLIQLCKCNPRRVTLFELSKSENLRIHAFPGRCG
jgi:hypothetical protein